MNFQILLTRIFNKTYFENMIGLEFYKYIRSNEKMLFYKNKIKYNFIILSNNKIKNKE